MRKRLRKLETKSDDVLPVVLQRSAPRHVVLTPTGRAVAGCAVLLVAAALGSAWLLAEKSAKDRALAQEAADMALYTDARVVNVRRTRGDSPQVRVSYRFTVAGREYAGNGKLAKRDPRWKTIAAGHVVRAGYLPSRPEANWMQGYDPNPVPLWVVFAAPVCLIGFALLLLEVIRRQRHMLVEGRAAMARVTGAKKIKKDESDGWRVEYEWRLLSGATRTGHIDKAGKAPPGDGFVPIVYDRDNPKRHAVYPLSLVRVAQM